MTAFALPFQGQETGAKTVSPNTASRSRALNRCAQSSRSTAFENTHPAVCSADLASSRNTASISTPQTSQTLPLEVPARVPHKKDDQDSTQPHRVESIKSLGDFSFSSSSTCDAILHRHRMSLQRNIATGYDFFNGLLGLIAPYERNQLHLVDDSIWSRLSFEYDCVLLIATYSHVQGACHEYL